MNPDEAVIFALMSTEEHALYRRLFGNASIPPWIKPASTEWADGLALDAPFVRYPKYVDPRPRFHAKGVGVVIGERRLAEVTAPEVATQMKTEHRRREERRRQKKRLRKNAA